MDIVPCHTSIEHPWFREHPDWYIWADQPNNWVTAFGGSAWEALDGRYYLHSFYPEQPDLDWRNPEVVAAMQDVLRFWLERGADGYRMDAIDRLLKDPQLRDDPPAVAALRPAAARGRGQAGAEQLAATRPTRAWRSPRSARPAATPSSWARSTSRARAGSPTRDYFDAVFAFELLHSPWDAGLLRAAIEAMHAPARSRVGDVQPRLRPAVDPLRRAERPRRGDAAAHAARAGVPLPGRRDRPGRGAARARRASTAPGRDRHRHPMQWDGSPSGGFTTGEPWLPLDGPGRAQRRGPARRPRLDAVAGARADRAAARAGGRSSSCSTPPTGSWPSAAASHTVAINTTSEPLPVAGHARDPRIQTAPARCATGVLAPHAGAIVVG